MKRDYYKVSGEKIKKKCMRIFLPHRESKRIRDNMANNSLWEKRRKRKSHEKFYVYFQFLLHQTHITVFYDEKLFLATKERL